MTLGAVLLAAGAGSRWRAGGGEGSKLLADFGGQSVLCRALTAMRAASATREAVVTGDARVAAGCAVQGVRVIENRAVTLGLSHSIALGVRAMDDLDAVLLMAADQPALTGESVRRLIAAFAQGDCAAACLCDATHSGNPAIFARECFPALCALTGDRGARVVLRAFDARTVACRYPDELADADTPAALAALACTVRRRE